MIEEKKKSYETLIEGDKEMFIVDFYYDDCGIHYEIEFDPFNQEYSNHSLLEFVLDNNLLYSKDWRQTNYNIRFNTDDQDVSKIFQRINEICEEIWSQCEEISKISNVVKALTNPKK